MLKKKQKKVKHGLKSDSFARHTGFSWNRFDSKYKKG